MKLQYKVTIMVVFIIIMVLSFTSWFAVGQIERNMKKQVEKSVTNTAIAIASSPVIQNNIKTDNGQAVIQNYVEKVRLKSKVHFITVMNMHGIRYSHPYPEEIGKQFSGGDEKMVLERGVTYVSEAQGRLGKSLRAFAPIFLEGEQVGAVCVGVLVGDIRDEFTSFTKGLIPYFGIALLIGIIAAWALSINIKRTILGLEPKEISVIFNERETIINNMKDGLIAINLDGKVSLINDQAKEILNTQEHVDEKLMRHLREVLSGGERITNLEQKLSGGITVMSNYSAVKSKEGKLTGALVTFQDMTSVSKMAEELTGVQKLNWDLRAQQHEFMNKLHTIAGLIQLEEYEEVLDYIFQTFRGGEEINSVIEKIHDAPLAALLLAKYSKASEAKISMEIDRESNLNFLPVNISPHEIGAIVGNLIENSIEALKGHTGGKIYVSIKQDEKIIIKVMNNGKPISDEIRDKIFERGFSTKQGERGFGLFIIKEIVDSAGGRLGFTTSEEETTWIIEI